LVDTNHLGRKSFTIGTYANLPVAGR
jgi:hypothetical protein